MNAIKKILFTLVFLIALGGVGLWLLTKTLSPTVVKNLINRQLTSLTAQPSHIEGDINWQLFPRPGIKITQIHVGDDHAQSNSLYIENLLINLQLSPLLKGHLVFGELKVDGLKANLNPLTTNSDKNTIAAAAAIEKKPATAAVEFAINHFLLTHGQVTINQPGSKISLSALKIEAEQLNLKNNDFPLQFKAKINATMPEAKLRSSLNYKGKIRLTPSIFREPQQVLQNLSLNGQLLIQNLQYNQVKIGKINSRIQSKAGTINFKPFNLSLYSGESTGDLSYQINTNKLTINQTATKLNAEQLSQDLFAKNVLQGNLDFSLHAATLLQNHWQASLSGHGDLSIHDGTLYLVDLNKFMDGTLSKLYSLINQGPYDVKVDLAQRLLNSPVPESGSTKFQLLNVQYHLQDAKFIQDSLVLQTDRLLIKGHGEVNLVDSSQQFNLSVQVNTNDSTINKVQQIVGGTFPLQILGKITSPKILPDMNVLSPILSNFIIKRAVVDPAKKMQKQVQKRLEDLLHDADLLPRKDNQEASPEDS
jgi:uncharacterized protein involved in outer membrane biogenesis